MQAVLQKQFLSRLLVPAEHRAVNVEIRDAIIAAGERPDSRVGVPCATDGQPALRARLDADEYDTRLRQPVVYAAHQSLELHDHLLRSLTAVDVVVARIDHHQSRFMGKDGSSEEADGVGERRAPEAAVDDREIWKVLCRVPIDDRRAADEDDLTFWRRVPAIHRLESGHFPVPARALHG